MRNKGVFALPVLLEVTCDPGGKNYREFEKKCWHLVQLVVEYNCPEGERTADSDSYSPEGEKKYLTSYRKYATIVNVKRRYPKESRLTARGQGKKLVTRYLKDAILESRKEMIQKVRQPSIAIPVTTDSASCQAINNCGQLSPSWLNRGRTLKTEHLDTIVWEPLAVRLWGCGLQSLWVTLAWKGVREHWCYWRATAT